MSTNWRRSSKIAPQFTPVFAMDNRFIDPNLRNSYGKKSQEQERWREGRDGMGGREGRREGGRKEGKERRKGGREGERRKERVCALENLTKPSPRELPLRSSSSNPRTIPQFCLSALIITSVPIMEERLNEEMGRGAQSI